MAVLENNDPNTIVVVGARPKPQSSGSFNINTFIADIRQRGVVKTHSFMVNIVPPKVLQSKWNDTRNILIRCEGAALPASNFMMAELYRHGYGPQETSPHNIQFEPVNLTFLIDSNAEIYAFWYQWMNAIMNFNRANGLNSTDDQGKRAYEMAYKDDFATEIKVLIYNEDADAVIQATMLMAFPMGIPEAPVNWNNTNELLKINIPISYRDYFVQTAFSDVSKNASSLIPSILPTSQMNKNSVQDSYRALGFTPNNPNANRFDQLIADIQLV